MKLTRDRLSALLGFKSQNKSVDSEKEPMELAEKEPMELAEKEPMELAEKEPMELAEKEPMDLDQNSLDLSENASLPQSVDVREINEDIVDIIDSDQPLLDYESKTSETELKSQESNMEYDEHLIIANFTKEQLMESEARLAEFMRVCTGAYGALISTVDGHEIAYSLKRDIPPHKISTMNSSLLALGESIARESLQQLCQFVILENSDGRVVSLRINDILMLTCISTKSTNLGMLLSTGRNTADSLAKILQ